MKQQQSDTRKKPSRLCKFLLLLVGFKICLLTVVLLEPFISLGSLFPATETIAQTQKLTPEAPEASEPAQFAVSGKLDNSQISQPANRQHGAAYAATAEPVQPPQPQGAVGRGPNQPGNLTLDALNRKQEELARREQDLRALEQELDARFVQMQALEQRLETMLRDAEETKGEKYKHLIDVLSNMKARQAAEVLETLDEKIAVRVLAGMRGRQAGEILTFASPTKAARLTEALARMQMPLE